MTMRYFWDEWLSLPSFLLRHGEHFNCSRSSITQQARNAASDRGLRISVVEVADGVLIRVRGRRERAEKSMKGDAR